GGSQSSAFDKRLAVVEDADRQRSVADVVRTHDAAALGHASTGADETSRAFQGLGNDSLKAVVLRLRLQRAGGAGEERGTGADMRTAGVVPAFTGPRARPFCAARAGGRDRGVPE
ncbi:acyl carrier protein, partial [Streptomyces sp. BE303]|uniref:acyl carrier protein n=1 Tax=Streptomyces sp. BE303 TaxID=3002528 RepID=UPI002E785B86